jgi:soluble lytic murein transglycosylase-like protein
MLEIIVAMLVANSTPGAVPAEQLAPAIVAAGSRHGIDPTLVAQIVLVESGGVPGAYNASTEDHGLMQINEATRKAYNVSMWCAKQWQCNLDSATRILADMWRIRGARPCMFNLGPRGRLPQYETSCLRYEKKLDMMIAEVL